jgi:hypothetical protein
MNIFHADISSFFIAERPRDERYFFAISRASPARLVIFEKNFRSMLPDDPKAGIQAHLKHVKHLHAKDLREGYGSVFLPNALGRKYKNAARQWGWQG